MSSILFRSIAFGSVFLLISFVCGCGETTEPTAPAQDELSDYLSENPDVANEAAPEMEPDSE